MTATGQGGAASATATATDIVVSAPLPPVSIGTQTVRRGIAGNLQTDDGRATVTWQPGAVPVGKTVSLTAFDGTLAVPGSEVSLSVPGLSSKGFRWPARPDVRAATADPNRARLLDGRKGLPLGATAPAGTASARDGRRLVRRREQPHARADADSVPGLPVQAGRLGRSHLHLPDTGRRSRPRPSSRPSPIPPTRRLLLLTRLAVHSQARMSAWVTGPARSQDPDSGQGQPLRRAAPDGDPPDRAGVPPEAGLDASAPAPQRAHASARRVQPPRRPRSIRGDGTAASRFASAIR